jgi:hypothetical protein
MSIQWNPDEISAFFGVKPDIMPIEDSGSHIFVYRYTGSNLRYELWLWVDDDQLTMSGDTEVPFGTDSLYEICLPCDSVSLVKDGYYPGQMALAFWHGPQSDRKSLRLKILKRPDGDLKVWPEYPFPDRHPLGPHDV